jgi:hypothetical protein
MAKIRRGNYVFITWKGDHSPRHVHVYKDAKLIVKWDLDNGKAMKGKATKRVLELIRQLQIEGLL